MTIGPRRTLSVSVMRSPHAVTMIEEKTASTNPRPAQETLRDFAELMRQSGRTAEADRLTTRAEAFQAAKK